MTHEQVALAMYFQGFPLADQEYAFRARPSVERMQTLPFLAVSR